jgi:HSP20 family protein
METLERQNLDAGAPLGAGSNLGGAYGGDMGRQYLKDMYKRGRISKQEYKALRRKNKLPYETYTYQNYPGQAMGPFGGYSGRIESLGGSMSGQCGNSGLGGGLAERRYDIGGGPIGGLGTMGGMEAMGAGGMGGLEGGMMGRPIDENRFFKLPHYGKINENPNIDNSTLWRPRADIFEIDHGHMRVEFELPGVPREDISLTIQENILTLAALKPQTRKEEVGFHYQNERHFGKFYRRIMLPFSADPNKVKAQMDNGVLKVDLVRVPGSGTGRIPIHEGLIGSSTSMGASAGTSTRV